MQEVLCVKVLIGKKIHLMPKSNVQALQDLYIACIGMYDGYGMPEFTPELQNALNMLRVYAFNTSGKIQN